MGTVNILEGWDVWCFFRRMLFNSNTLSETLINEGEFSPPVSGILRSGIKEYSINSTEKIREYYAIAFSPDISRLCNSDYPMTSKLRIDVESCVLNAGETEFVGTIKPWAKSGGIPHSYLDIVDNYIPFDVTSYDAEIYETQDSITPSEYYFQFEDIIATIWKYMKSQSSGFMLVGQNGIVDIYGPEYSSVSFHPALTIIQTISNKRKYKINLQTEIKSLSKIKGVCNDKDGNRVTGSSCKVYVFSLSFVDLIGSGESNSANGTFLIEVEAKYLEQVLVTYFNESENIFGSEIMRTVSKVTV